MPRRNIASSNREAQGRWGFDRPLHDAGAYAYEQLQLDLEKLYTTAARVPFAAGCPKTYPLLDCPGPSKCDHGVWWTWRPLIERGHRTTPSAGRRVFRNRREVYEEPDAPHTVLRIERKLICTECAAYLLCRAQREIRELLGERHEQHGWYRPAELASIIIADNNALVGLATAMLPDIEAIAGKPPAALRASEVTHLHHRLTTLREETCNKASADSWREWVVEVVDPADRDPSTHLRLTDWLGRAVDRLTTAEPSELVA